MKGDDFGILARLSERDTIAMIFAGAWLAGRGHAPAPLTDVVGDAWKVGEAMADCVIERAAANTDEVGDGA